MSSFSQPALQAHVQLLSVGAAESSPTALVITEKDRFLINVGEGSQRLAMEHKVRLLRLDHIFITSLTPDCIGGLPGMLLTLADGHKTSITIHGPVGLRRLLRSTSHFMRRDELKMTVREYSAPDLAAQGPTLAMYALPLSLPATRQEGAAAADSSTNGDEPCSKRPRSDGARKAESGPVLAWIGQTATVMGKFDVKAAKALGIPAGPTYGKLKNGEAITLDDGRVIQPEEVVAPSIPGALFGFVYCPTVAFLDSLPPAIDWIETLQNGGNLQQHEEKNLSCLMHYSSAEIASHKRYQAWMATFGAETTHVLASLPQGAHRSPFRASRLNNLRLHLLDPKAFPRAATFSKEPAGQEAMMVAQAQGGSTSSAATSTANGHGSISTTTTNNPLIVWGENLLRYNLIPKVKQGIDRSGSLTDLTSTDETELRADAEAKAVPLWNGSSNETTTQAPALQQPTICDPSHHHQHHASLLEDGPGADVEVVFLGTGSAMPSKYRNVSGIYVRLQKGGMLLDVGEGSLGQLASLYKDEDLQDVLLGLRAIWVSHPHADHHLGLMRVVTARRAVAKARALAQGEDEAAAEPPSLVIIAPRPVSSWLREYHDLVPEINWGKNDHLVDLDKITPESLLLLRESLGLKCLTNVRVDHCPFAYAAVIDALAGWRLVYSGDTRPCERLVQAGKGATVLIHEATFGAGKDAEAIERRHSTVEEALDVARRMETTAVILTHFSQRYPKFPVLPQDSDMRICVAFDLMKVKFRDLIRVSKLLPALQQLFPVEDNTAEEAEAVGQLA